MPLIVVQHATSVAFYLLSLHVLHSNTKSSNHWRLDECTGLIHQVWGDSDELCAGGGGDYYNSSSAVCRTVKTDKTFDIINSRKYIDVSTGFWTVVGFSHMEQNLLSECDELDYDCILMRMDGKLKVKEQPPPMTSKSTVPNGKKAETTTSQLTCGNPANNTPFDHLAGISNRESHQNLIEPDAAVIFKKKGTNEVDMNSVEKQLRKKPKSVHLYNQIGNFWRVKGNTLLAIECFRKALSIGEILEAYGSPHEAAKHYRHTLELNGNFQTARSHLERLDAQLQAPPSFTVSTSVILVLLVLCFVVGLLFSIDLGLDHVDSPVTTVDYHDAGCPEEYVNAINYSGNYGVNNQCVNGGRLKGRIGNINSAKSIIYRGGCKR